MANFLRITASGWDSFTGNFGGVDFVDGLSTDVVNRHQIDHLSGLVRCDLADADGNLLGQGGIAARLVGGVNISEAPTALRKATQDEIDADARRRAAEVGKAPTPIYTKEELETIAAKEGLTGLRKIGDAWSVRDRAIGKLITLIVNAQKAFTVTVNARNALVAESRAKAAQDILDSVAARNADIDARAKLAGTVAGTSNAIGANGENVTMPPAPAAEPVVVVAPIVASSTSKLNLAPGEEPRSVSDALAGAVEHLAEELHATPAEVAAAAETVKSDLKV